MRTSLLAFLAVAAAEEPAVRCHHRETKKLRNGVLMPRVAFGTAALPRGEGHEAVISAALDAGFRSFDTAMAREWYDETSVARALNASGLPRSELFVTTKIHPRFGYLNPLNAMLSAVPLCLRGGSSEAQFSDSNRDLGYDATLEAVHRSLQTFGTSSIDLVLLHYPRCFPGVCTAAEQRRTEKVAHSSPCAALRFQRGVPVAAHRPYGPRMCARRPAPPPQAGGWAASWAALGKLAASGLVRARGVSNFNVEEVRRIPTDTFPTTLPAPGLGASHKRPREDFDFTRVMTVSSLKKHQDITVLLIRSPGFCPQVAQVDPPPLVVQNWFDPFRQDRDMLAW